MEIPGFQIVGRIGKGGMGEVFHAVRVGPGGFRKPVALKRLNLDHSIDARMVQRFFAEARISAQLDHPNVVRVHDLLVVDDGHFIVMELLRGRNLASLRDELAAVGPLPWWLPFAIAEQALAGLEYAHALRDEDGKALGLVHRDLTPRNVFVCDSGVVKILDFGIAKLRHALTPALTRDGNLQGTLEFLAPEQARAEEADARTDLYQLAGSIYWALTGEFPHGRGTPAEIVARAVQGPLRPVSELRPGVPQAAAAVIAKAMAAERADRYADAGEMLAAVRKALSEVDGAGAEVIAAAMASLPAGAAGAEGAVAVERAAADREARAAMRAASTPRPGASNVTPSRRVRSGPSANARTGPEALAPTLVAKHDSEPEIRDADADGPPADPVSGPAPRRAWPYVAVTAAIALGAAVGAFAVGRSSPRRAAVTLPVPTETPRDAALDYRRLTFRRGSVHSARFTVDGQMIYSASWDGGDSDTFHGKPGEPEARSLRLPGTEILAVSAAGDLALIGDVETYGYVRRGVLATTKLTSGVPRDVIEDVQWADYAPDGELAVVRWTEGRARIEYPIGTTVHQVDSSLAWLGDTRVAPDGKRIAFVRHDIVGDDAGSVAVLDLADRHVTTLSADHPSVQGLAWSPAGDEVLFTAGSPRALRAVSLDGRERVIDRAPAWLTLLDVSRDGEILVRRDLPELRTIADGDGRPARDVSWFHFSYPSALSPDGGTVLLIEGGSEANPDYGVYLRPVEGEAPAVKMNAGFGSDITADGKWFVGGPTRGELWLIPTGAGERQRFTTAGIGTFVEGAWLPGERQMFLFATTTAAPSQVAGFVYDRDQDAVRMVRDRLGFVSGNMVAPDGKSVIARDPDREELIRVSLADGTSTPVRGAKPGENFASFAPDGRTLYVASIGETPLRIDQLDLETGARRLWHKLTPPDVTGMQTITQLIMTPDARSWAYAYYRNLSTLYLIEGAR